MQKDIAAIREDYGRYSLDERDTQPDPVQQFRKWFDEAVRANTTETNAMVLSTIGPDGFPSARVVLLKDIKPDGFSFFTNYTGKKGRDMAENDRVSLLFFWPELQRQVRIEGRAEKLPATESDEYFATRPKASRISAIASPQSRPIENRAALEAKVDELAERFAGTESVPRPDFWGGYLVRPVRMEFWQGRSNRLHDRIAYTLEAGRWTRNRLAP